MRQIFVALLILFVFSISAIEIGGIELPDNYNLNDNNLLLNGAGLRKKVIIKVNACGLYLQSQENNAEKILNSNTDIAIRMHFIYKEVDNEKLITAWNEGFASTGASETFVEEIAKFNSFFDKPALKNDIYMITYDQTNGTSVYVNDTLIGSIAGKNFRKAVFSIWLGENSALPKLKKALLGD